ncbi:MAG: restriction endonuclease [Alistipes sp.]|nr:restriction endonuclease [Alistipes sp.]MDY5396944.1 restriction endonuclease [Alistipes sp.]
MNLFTQRSIELASQRDYLDQLFSVYPLSPDNIREVDQNIWNNVDRCYREQNNTELFRNLLQLKLFPIKDGYVPYFRKDITAIERNPNTVNRICGRVRELSLEELYQKCTQPKETNRQMGQLFRNWVKRGTLGLFPISEAEFLADDRNAILDGSDTALLVFARNHLGYRRDKGVDFIGRFNHTYVIGEAKFISDEGGHQNDQFLDAMTTIKTPLNQDVIAIGILDGILYIPSRKKCTGPSPPTIFL